MYNKINVSEEWVLQAGEQAPLKRLKQNDAKYMNAIKPYVKERKISKRDSKNLISSSPYQTNKSKSRKHESSCKKGLEDLTKNSRCLSDVYLELQTLKSEYRALKDSYSHLKKENEQLTERGIDQYACLLREIDKQRREAEKYREKMEFGEKEIERIKKECFRLVEGQKFKNKKMQEIIQQKQLMIAYLRSQLAALAGDSTNSNALFYYQHTVPTHNQPGIHTLSKISANNSVASSIGHAEFDLPMQIGSKADSISNKAGTLMSRGRLPAKSILKECPDELYSAKQKKSQALSQSEDSFSFSHDRSDNRIDRSGTNFDQPTILTFTKKDIIIFDEGDQNGEGDNRDESSEDKKSSSSSGHSNDFKCRMQYSDSRQSEDYTGEGYLPTFENRNTGQKNKSSSHIGECVSRKRVFQKEHTEVRCKKNRANNRNTAIKNQSDLINISSIQVRSKPTTKRLHIRTDDERLAGLSAKEKEEELEEISSSEIRKKHKKYVNHKKKPVRKRKSEEAPCVLHKK